jgi:hypothetical protein
MVLLFLQVIDIHANAPSKHTKIKLSGQKAERLALPSINSVHLRTRDHPQADIAEVFTSDKTRHIGLSAAKPLKISGVAQRSVSPAVCVPRFFR